jgi:hypothetical protein
MAVVNPSVAVGLLSGMHVEENERLAQGERTPRGWVQYPYYSNRNHAQGFTIYRTLGQQ